MAKKKNILLSISLLASNRKDTLKKCLDSLQPLRDAVTSELIIVDTGCDDELHQMLVDYADQVVRFEWCQDFAKARNAGLQLASGEWFLYIDDDEWFVESQELVDFFSGEKHKRYNYGHYIQRNYLDQAGTQYSDSWVTRFFRIRNGVRFVSKIHEYADPMDGDFIAVHAVVDHYGYVYKSEEEHLKHFERNYVLLKEMIEEEPDDLRWRVQLVQEYRSVKKYQEMYDFSLESLELSMDYSGKTNNINRGTFYLACIIGLTELKRSEEGLAFCERADQDQRNTDMCRAAVSLYRAELLLDAGDWAGVKRSVGKYFALYEKLKANEFELFLQNLALLVNETFDEMQIQKAYSLLICAGLKEGDTSALKKYLPELRWEGKHIYVFRRMTDILVEAMAALPYEEIFLETAKLVQKNGSFWNLFAKAVRCWEMLGRAGFPNLCNVLARLEGEDWYLCYIRLIDAEQKGHTEEYPAYLTGFFQVVKNVFLAYTRVRDFANRNHISLEDYYLAVPPQKWDAHLGVFIEKASVKQRQAFREFMASVRTRADWRYDYFDMRMSEADIVVGQNCGNYQALYNLFSEFAGRTLKFYQSYYREEIFESYPQLLPKSCQAAVFVRQALSCQDTDREQFAEALKRCAAVYPLFAGAIKEYLRLYGAERIKKEKAAKEEMRELTAKIKAEVQSLMDKGMLTEAVSVMQQLKQLLPQDLEVVNLSLKVRLMCCTAGISDER